LENKKKVFVRALETMLKSQKQESFVWNEEKQAWFWWFLMVSSIRSMLRLLPFLTVDLHQSGIRKAIFWSVTKYNKNLSSQFSKHLS